MEFVHPLRYNGGMADRTPEPDAVASFSWRCWSCQTKISEENGVSISDNHEIHVCQDCWRGIKTEWRLILGLLFRRADQGGLGLADLIDDTMKKYPNFQGPFSAEN